ncbi:phosphomannomutase/phosphoglucomutase [Phaeovibrio sulfidiphilus]|uniref:Phosphomannomutase/phosphoglucomutase n=1 Tax=Phaeovibrio sulfidiphilus TaxID=1220600 RepID=A0A8J6YN24_9PROT|nr:phosphomannomutase/phosphoglucomutase [Phaeovibrio sulfidiphilus]
MHCFHPGILREYDIRGIVGETLFAEDARVLGQVFGTVLRDTTPHPHVFVGRDGRLSSPELCDALAEGLLSTGARVSDLGIAPTPLVYYAHMTRESDGAIQVTGSHNPAGHNGFKMMRARRSLSGRGVAELGYLASRGAFASGAGERRRVDLQPAYVAELLRGWPPGARPLRVVWDPGNGAAGPCVEALCARLPGNHHVINAAVDGRFPAHHPDPADPATLTQLQDAVVRLQADVGLAFDADGDRLGVVDPTGRVLPADLFLLLLARGVLARHPGTAVLADVKSSDVLFETLRAMGARPVVCRTGHTLIRRKMVELGALLAGEMSGHVFFADAYHGFDDALYAAVRVLGEVAALDGPLSEWVGALPPRATTPEIRIPCADSRKWAVVERVRERLRAERADVSEIDGVRVRRPGGWWLLRVSNTQAALVARAEATDAATLDTIRNDLDAYLNAALNAVP